MMNNMDIDPGYWLISRVGEELSNFDSASISSVRRFSRLFTELCDQLQAFTDLRRRGYKPVFALDLSELVSYHIPYGPYKHIDANLQGSLLSKFAIEAFESGKFSFTFLPGTMFEIGHFLNQFLASSNKFKDNYQYFVDKFSSLDMIDENLFDTGELKKYYLFLKKYINQLYKVDSLCRIIDKFTKLPNYVSSNELIDKSALGWRRYKKWYELISGFAWRENKIFSNIADATNLAIIPAINGSLDKILVSLTTRTPTLDIIKRSDDLKVNISISHNIDEIDFPIFHKPSLIVLAKLIDPYNNLTLDRFAKIIHRLNHFAMDLRNSTNQFEIEFKEYTGFDPLNIKNLIDFFNETRITMTRSEVKIALDFFRLFLLDSDYAHQVYVTTDPSVYKDHEILSEQIELDKLMADTLRTTSNVLSLSSRMSDHMNYQIEIASRDSKSNYYIIHENKQKKSKLAFFNYEIFRSEVKSDNGDIIDKILIYSKAQLKDNDCIAGFNRLPSGWKNIYWLQNRGLIKSLDAYLSILLKFNSSCDIFGFDLNGRFECHRVDEIRYLRAKDILKYFESKPIVTFQIENTTTVFTYEKSKNYRPPYISLRYLGDLPNSFFDLHKNTHDGQFSADLMEIFLTEEGEFSPNANKTV